MQKTIITNNPILTRKKVISSSWENERYRVYWEGLVFINGIRSGNDSVESFIKMLHTQSIQDACSILKGIFFISIEVKPERVIYAFIDHSGLYQSFYSRNRISTSFLELTKYDNHSSQQLDPAAIVEFLSFGVLFFNKTFIKTISRIPRDIILKFNAQNKKIEILKKNIPSLDEFQGNASEKFHEGFSGLAKSFSNLNISLDFTGGTDTRLIALMLDYYGLEFETAVSGGTDQYDDVFISKSVSASIGHPWYRSLHSIELLEDDIPQLMHDTEGLNNILHYHRLYQLQKARRDRGVDTIISGVGGDLFKDFWWFQDFPFYGIKSANIERLLDMRIMSSVPAQSLFAMHYAVLNKSLRHNLLQELSLYKLDSNTKTYDNICFNFRMREEAGRELTNYGPYVKTYAPLLDLDIVRIGFNLPRMMRFFSYFHRKELTALNPDVAQLSTTEGGISASSELGMIAKDIPKYIIDKMSRLLLKLRLRKQNKALELNHPEFYKHARRINSMRESLSILKDIGIINHSVQAESVSDAILGRLLTLGQLILLLNKR